MATRNSLGYRIRRVFAPSLHESEATAAITTALRDARETVAMQAKKIQDLEAELRLRDVEVKVCKQELICLAGVIARDRLRIQSETAIFASTVAKHTGSAPSTED